MKGGKGARAPYAMRKELEKILENEEFVKELMLKETREEAKKAIEEKGVLATDEEMEELYQFYSALYKECQKMSKEQLLQISGGGPGDDEGICLVEDEPGEKSNWGKIGDAVAGSVTKDISEHGLAGTVKRYGEAIKSLVPGGRSVRGSGQVVSGYKQNQKEQHALKHKLVNAGCAAVGLVTAASLVYTFKDDIKSWLRSK